MPTPPATPTTAPTPAEPKAAEPAAPSEATPSEPAAKPEAEAPAAAGADAAAEARRKETESADEASADKDVKRLLVPQAKAKILGRIELPAEAIKDAKRRSAPGGGRNPGNVDRNLRRAALRSTQSRTASRTGGRSGPGVRRGPGSGPGGRRGPGRGGRKGPTTGNLSSTVDPNKVIEIQPPITVKGLSEAIGVKVNDLIAALTFKLGVIGKNINSFLTNDEVELVALEVKRNIKLVERIQAEEELLQNLVEAAEDIQDEPRPPVVTFLGHVDHGKTSLLDRIIGIDVVSRRERRHHAAHPCLSDREGRAADRLSSTRRATRPSRQMRARGANLHRHRGAGGRRRRRRDAADRRGHQPRQGGRRADRRGAEQNRPARRQRGPGVAATGHQRAAAERMGRRRRAGQNVRPRPARASTSSAGYAADGRRAARVQGEPERPAVGRLPGVGA